MCVREGTVHKVIREKEADVIRELAIVLVEDVLTFFAHFDISGP